MEPPSLVLSADVSEGQLSRLDAGELRSLYAAICRLVELFEAAAEECECLDQRFSYELDAWQASQIAKKVRLKFAPH